MDIDRIRTKGQRGMRRTPVIRVLSLYSQCPTSKAVPDRPLPELRNANPLDHTGKIKSNKNKKIFRGSSDIFYQVNKTIRLTRRVDPWQPIPKIMVDWLVKMCLGQFRIVLRPPHFVHVLFFSGGGGKNLARPYIYIKGASEKFFRKIRLGITSVLCNIRPAIPLSVSSRHDILSL